MIGAMPWQWASDNLALSRNSVGLPSLNDFAIFSIFFPSFKTNCRKIDCKNIPWMLAFSFICNWVGCFIIKVLLWLSSYPNFHACDFKFFVHLQWAGSQIHPKRWQRVFCRAETIPEQGHWVLRQEAQSESGWRGHGQICFWWKQKFWLQFLSISGGWMGPGVTRVDPEVVGRGGGYQHLLKEIWQKLEVSNMRGLPAEPESRHPGFQFLPSVNPDTS